MYDSFNRTSMESKRHQESVQTQLSMRPFNRTSMESKLVKSGVMTLEYSRRLLIEPVWNRNFNEVFNEVALFFGF